MMSVLTWDWFGFVNVIAMVISVIVRWVVVQQNREAIDRAVRSGMALSGETVQTFWILPNGKAVTIVVPRGILINCFLTTPRPPYKRSYVAARLAGWFGFGCHVISLGMTALINQIFTIVVLIGATLLTTFRVSEVPFRIGLSLELSRTDAHDENDARTEAYLRLRLSTSEEAKMADWNLFPHQSNNIWWNKYRTLQRAQKAERSGSEAVRSMI